MARVLVPLPDTDFDPTETAVPWRLLREAGHEVAFATESGRVPRCDPLLLTGVVFGKLGAEMEQQWRRHRCIFMSKPQGVPDFHSSGDDDFFGPAWQMPIGAGTAAGDEQIVVATQAVATKSLTVNTAATTFTPVTGSGGTSPLAYSISPALPAGLTLASATGVITGTPTESRKPSEMICM